MSPELTSVADDIRPASVEADAVSANEAAPLLASTHADNICRFVDASTARLVLPLASFHTLLPTVCVPLSGMHGMADSPDFSLESTKSSISLRSYFARLLHGLLGFMVPEALPPSAAVVSSEAVTSGVGAGVGAGPIKGNDIARLASRSMAVQSRTVRQLLKGKSLC